MIAYADDFVYAFRYHRDTARFMKALKERFEKFGLELAKDKTNMIRFSRFTQDRNETFDFLGFAYRWDKSRKGKDIIKMSTARKKFIASARRLKEWIRDNLHQSIRRIIDQLNVKLRGYYNYYGDIGYYTSLDEMFKIAKRLLYKWLNRRSQRRSFNKKEFEAKLKRNYPLLKPFVENGNVQLKVM